MYLTAHFYGKVRTGEGIHLGAIQHEARGKKCYFLGKTIGPKFVAVPLPVVRMGAVETGWTPKVTCIFIGGQEMAGLLLITIDDGCGVGVGTGFQYQLTIRGASWELDGC